MSIVAFTQHGVSSPTAQQLSFANSRATKQWSFMGLVKKVVLVVGFCLLALQTRQEHVDLWEKQCAVHDARVQELGRSGKPAAYTMRRLDPESQHGYGCNYYSEMYSYSTEQWSALLEACDARFDHHNNRPWGATPCRNAEY